MGDRNIALEILEQEPKPYPTIFVPAANHTLAYGVALEAGSRAKVVSVVLPNHPYLRRTMTLRAKDIKGYESIDTSWRTIERRYRKLQNTYTTSVSRKRLYDIRKEHKDGEFDLAVYLALEVSKRYNGIKIVLGTGVRR